MIKATLAVMALSSLWFWVFLRLGRKGEQGK